MLNPTVTAALTPQLAILLESFSDQPHEIREEIVNIILEISRIERKILVYREYKRSVEQEEFYEVQPLPS